MFFMHVFPVRVIITARKRSLGEGNVFTGVCLFTGGAILSKGVPSLAGSAILSRGVLLSRGGGGVSYLAVFSRAVVNSIAL